MKPDPSKPFIPPLLAIGIGILAVSTASIFIRYAQVHAPSLVIAAYRLTIATIVLFPWALPRRNELSLLSRREFILVLLSGFFLAIHFATWITSLAFTSVASSVVLVTTTPLFVALFSPFTIRESLTRVVSMGMVLALFGSGIVGMSDSCSFQKFVLQCPSLADFIRGKAFIGDLLALAGAIAAAGYVLIGRRIRVKLSLASYVFAVYGVAAITLVGYVILMQQPLVGYPPIAFVWFILLALIPQLIGHSTFNWALGYLSAAFVAITLLGEPIGSTILAYLLLDEKPTALKLFGAILIFAGILVASSSEHHSSRQLPREEINS